MAADRLDKVGEADGDCLQVHIWDGGREAAVGTVEDEEGEWSAVVVIEAEAEDLARGRLSFRLGDARYDTAPIIVEESAEAVVERAAELPASMLRQLLMAARE